MTTTVKVNSSLIVTWMAIISSVFSAGWWVTKYHDSLATKKEVNLIFVELRIGDAQDTLFEYDERETLTSRQQNRYEKIQTTLHRLETSRDRILGLEK